MSFNELLTRLICISVGIDIVRGRWEDVLISMIILAFRDLIDFSPGERRR